MDAVKPRNQKIEETNLNILNAPSPGAGQVVRDAHLNRTSATMHGLRHETKDVLQQMQSHLNQLEDLSARLGFILTDVRSVVRR